MNAELFVLRLVHVLGGIFWVGSGLFTTFFLVPALSRPGAPMGPVMGALQQRRLFLVLPAVAVLTILSGLRLLWIASAGFSDAYLASPMGRAFSASGGAAIVAFVLSLAVARPAAVRAGQLAASLAATTDAGARRELAARLQRLRRRGSVASIVAVALLIVAAAGMAVARYLG